MRHTVTCKPSIDRLQGVVCNAETVAVAKKHLDNSLDFQIIY